MRGCVMALPIIGWLRLVLIYRENYYNVDMRLMCRRRHRRHTIPPFEELGDVRRRYGSMRSTSAIGLLGGTGAMSRLKRSVFPSKDHAPSLQRAG